MPKQISGLKSSDFRPLRINMRLFPLAYQIYLWCLQVANKGRLPLVFALKCGYFSLVSLVSERVSSFWPRVLSSHDGENRAFGALLLLWSNEDSLWSLTSGFWVGLFLISRGKLLWTKVSTGLQVIPPVSVLSISQNKVHFNGVKKDEEELHDHSSSSLAIFYLLWRSRST